jgi:hypothetical protein
MSDRRLGLHGILCNVLSCPASGEGCRAYFQPPPTVTLKYPAIVYELNNIDTKFADNILYNSTRRYSVTLIDKDPDSSFVESLINLPKSRLDRQYKSDNLNHYVFTIYY